MLTAERADNSWWRHLVESFRVESFRVGNCSLGRSQGVGGTPYGCSTGYLLVLGPAAWTPPLRDTLAFRVSAQNQPPTVLRADEGVVRFRARG